MTWHKSYSELRLLESFEDRFEYLRLGGGVGQATFGFDRHINQIFYGSAEWQSIRDHVLLRDNGCDLGVRGYEIHISPLIHHINPMTVQDILDRSEWILDPDFLITTTHDTHNAIHYGSPSPYPKTVIQRVPGDTRLW